MLTADLVEVPSLKNEIKEDDELESGCLEPLQVPVIFSHAYLFVVRKVRVLGAVLEKTPVQRKAV